MHGLAQKRFQRAHVELAVRDALAVAALDRGDDSEERVCRP
jgi:hypothetical protein